MVIRNLFWRMEIEKILREKVKFGKFSTESENFRKKGGKTETEGKCIMVSGRMDTPVDLYRSSSIPRFPASSIYVLSLISRSSSIYVISLIFRAFRWSSPHSWNSRALWISRVFYRPTSYRWFFLRFLDFSRFLPTYVVSLDFPRFRRSSGYLSFPRFRRSARSSRSPASSISRVSRWSYYRVLLRQLIGAIAFSIECLRKPFWI